jgi:hypothetical protein
VVVLAIVAVIAGAAFVAARDGSSPLDRAVELVADEGRFTDAAESSETLASASVLLLDAARSCEPGEGALVSRCDARFQAAAYTQVLAAEVVRCPPAGRQEVRLAMASYLRALANETEAAAPPDPPSQPRCG